MPNEVIALRNGKRTNSVRDKLNETTLVVCGTKYKVSFVPRLIERYGIMGQTDFYNETFCFDENMTEGALISTIIHEALEVINRKFQLEATHQIINILETGLIMFLKDNPNFVMALVELLQKDEEEKKQIITDTIKQFLEEGVEIKKEKKKKKSGKKPKK